MYNKLFSRILWSSIWTHDYPTRIVWVTFLAAMDEDGVVHFATPKNVAAIAQVTEEEAVRAVTILEAPDANSANPEHEGRRVQRIPGGWLVLNAGVYKRLATREQAREGTRRRMAKLRACDADVRRCDADVRIGDGDVRISDADVTPSETETETKKRSRSSRGDDLAAEGFASFWQAYPRKVAKAAALKAWAKLRPDAALQASILAGLWAAVRSEQWQRDGGAYIPHPATWLNGRRWEDDLTPAALTVVGSDPVEAERKRAAQLLADMQAKQAAAVRRRQEGGAA